MNTNAHCSSCGRPCEVRVPIETPVLCDDCRDLEEKLEQVECRLCESRACERPEPPTERGSGEARDDLSVLRGGD